jgi:hypothetical protein
MIEARKAHSLHQKSETFAGRLTRDGLTCIDRSFDMLSTIELLIQADKNDA